MSGAFDDLESMRRRIRDEGRRRREEELRRRRENREAKRRRRSSSASSSCSRDLLLSSSPSPSPPPKVMADSSSANADILSSVATISSNSQQKQKQERDSVSRVHCDYSESDSDFDLADVSRHLAERRKMEERAERAQSKRQMNAFNNNLTLKKSTLWSDDDSEEEVDVRKIIARKVAEKRKMEGIPASRDGDLECYRKMNSESNGDNITGEKSEQSFSKYYGLSPPNADRTQTSRKTKSGQDSTSSKKQIYLQSAPFVQNAALSFPNSEHSSKLISKSKQRDESTQDKDENMSSTAIQSFAKPTIASEPSRYIAASSTPPPKITSLIMMESNTNPIIGMEVRPRSNVDWIELKQCLLVRTVGTCSPKDKVAGFDLDQTLVNWRCAGWPSRPDHYELWSSSVIEKCRQLHDDGYKLVVFSNQGGIKNALRGKKAGTVKGIIDWIAKLMGRPLYAVCSTKKDSTYHKGKPGMWGIMEDFCNCGKRVRPDSSFFVGDADGTGADTANPHQRQHQQTGTDKLFAENVGKIRNATMAFYTPSRYFGPSNVERRQAMSSVEAPPPMPQEAIRARAALMGGYLSGPILLVLIGVQGSGKSTFSESLVDNSDGRWSVFSQDTLRTRHAVEEAAKTAIRNGKNVVIDRMHLDPEQRGIFLELGLSLNISVHGLVMMASKEEVEDRVKRRVNHPGKVEGPRGAQIAVASLSRLVIPQYDEGFALLSYSREVPGKLVDAYRQVDCEDSDLLHTPNMVDLHHGRNIKSPMVTLGTLHMKKHETFTIVSQAMQIAMGNIYVGIDTAPTYGNEREVGAALENNAIAVTIKVPKRVTNAEQARKEVEQSLSLLKCSKVDMILLHWPCDLIKVDTLSSVWKELEAMKREGLCHRIGVSNFSTTALKQLISCSVVKPALNQVERHPLLPQYDLIDYCDSEDITVQAHSPLGGGSKLLLANDTIVRVAEESKMSPAQVLLCWNLQQSIPVAVKCSSAVHWKEAVALLQNKSKLRLRPGQMKAIDDLSASGETHRFVAPPFMYCRGANYSWGDMPPG